MTDCFDFVLVPAGSHGDVLPHLAIGAQLRRRGHAVGIYLPEPFVAAAQRLDLRVIEVMPQAEYRATMDHPAAWASPLSGLRYAFEMGQRYLEPQYAAGVAHAGNPAARVLAGPLALGLRVAQETHALPLATLQLAPCGLRSVVRPPRLPLPTPGPASPLWLRRLADVLGARYLHGVLAPLQAFRNARGHSGRRLCVDWLNSPDLVLGAFPDWFAPPAPDWPAAFRQAGFVRFDALDGECLSEPSARPSRPQSRRGTRVSARPIGARANGSSMREPSARPSGPAFANGNPHSRATGWQQAPDVDLQEQVRGFLGRHGEPIVFTAGTAMAQPGHFLAAAVEASARLGHAAVLLTRHTSAVPPHLPDNVAHFDYLPLSTLLPHAAAIVHHGGAGTLAQALAAGVPQVVTPIGFDQPDNAAWLERLGVARSLPFRGLRGDRLAAALAAQLASPAVANATRECAERMRLDRGTQRACDILEAWARAV